MDLFDRLFTVNDIGVHYMYAALMDYAAGETTRQQVMNYWDLDASAQTDLNALCDHLDGLPGALEKAAFCAEFHAVAMFVEAGAKYTSKAAFRTRMGL